MARLALILSVFFLAGCGSTPRQTVWLGHVAPLRGAGQAIGLGELQGIRLAVQEVNKDEAQKLEQTVAVLHANANGNAACHAETLRLKHLNQVVGLLGGQDSQEAAGLDHEGLPVISPAGSRTAGTSKFVFLTGLSPQVKGQALAELALANLPPALSPSGWTGLMGQPFSPLGLGPLAAASRLAAVARPPARIMVLVDQRQPEFAQAGEAFAKALPKKAAEYFPALAPPALVQLNFASDQQLTDHLQQLAAEKPEAIFVAGEVNTLWKIRAAAGAKTIPLLYAGPEGSQAALLAGPQGGEGVFLVTAWVPDLDTAQNQAFVAKYQKMFGSVPDVHAAMAYDNARLLFEAMRQSKNVYTNILLRDKLAGLKDFALLTGNGSFDDENQWHRPAFFVQLRQGQAATVGRYEPK